MAPSSPRLPSPPPPAEIQITPNSPSGGPAATLQATEMEQSVIDANSKRRIHPGTKSADMATGPPLVPLSELESAFSLQEHLAALHYHHTSQGARPVDRATALQLAQPPTGVDRTLWLYELCRFLISQCNSLIVGFLFDNPPCSASTCPEMRASEWQFLCAVHEQPKSCCAIDYCCHTLDWAANVVSDQKIFPSRFVVLNDAHSKNVGVKNLVNVFRRLHRIFAHAWFQHRSVFWAVEAERGLYVFFKTVCDLYDLLPAENYKLPPEAEGLESQAADTEAEKAPRTILKPPVQSQGISEDDSLHPSNRTNTRRHIRSSPSTGSSVTTVMEAEEEEADSVARDLDNMHISTLDPASGNSEASAAMVETVQSNDDKPAESLAESLSMEDGSVPDPEASADETVEEVSAVDGPEEGAAAEPTEAESGDTDDAEAGKDAAEKDATKTTETSTDQTSEQPASKEASAADVEKPITEEEGNETSTESKTE